MNTRSRAEFRDGHFAFASPEIGGAFFVYALEDIGGAAFYVGVGQTKRRDHGFRPNDHLRDALSERPRSTNHLKLGTIRRLLGSDSVYLRIVAETDDHDHALDVERCVIHLLGRRICGAGRLTNFDSGGRGGNIISRLPPERRAEIALARRPRTPTPEQIEKTASKLRGRPHSPERIAKRVAAMLGKTANHGSRNGNFGRPRPDHVKEAVRRANTGREQSPADVAKRAADCKVAHMRKQLPRYAVVLQMLNEGATGRAICRTTGVSQDLVTKVRKERDFIEQMLAGEC